MKILKKSLISGLWHTREIDVTQEQIDRWNNGELIQRAMPNLSDDDREFILTGSTPEEWDAEFGAADDDEDDEEAF